MARILINTAEVVNSGSKARAAKSTTGSVVGRIAGVRSGTDSQILSRGGLGSRLDAVYNKVAQLEREIAAIQNAVENGAMQYQRTEASLDNLSRTIMGISSKSTTAMETRLLLEKMFVTDTQSGEEICLLPDANITTEQAKAILKAVETNDMNLVLETMGICSTEELTEEQRNVIGTVWKDLKDSLCENVSGNLLQDVGVAALESSKPIMTSLASFINTATAVAKGPEVANSFIIVNPSVVSKTSGAINMGSKVSSLMSSTAAKIGVPVIGGILDFGCMLHDGEEVEDAAIKAVAHVGIGLAGGAAGAKIGAIIGTVVFPGIGTVAGAVVGILAGVAITTIGNGLFDAIYDNREAIGESISEGIAAAKEWAAEQGEKVEQTVSDVKEYLGEKTAEVGQFVGQKIEQAGDFLEKKVSEIGAAWVSGWNILGSVFG